MMFERVMALSGAERLIMGCDMFDTARASRSIPTADDLWSDLGIASDGETVSFIANHPGTKLRSSIAENGSL